MDAITTYEAKITADEQVDKWLSKFGAAASAANIDALLARISQTTLAIERGFAKRFVGVLRTSFGVASGDAVFLESLTSCGCSEEEGFPWAFG
jgi:hypothetical protein